jgi:hypothetical protein
MKSEVIEINENAKREFDDLCQAFKLDKQTKLRAIYLFDTFLESRMAIGKEAPPNSYATYLKVSMFVSSKNGFVNTVDGREIRSPGIRLTSLFKDTTLQ